MLTRRLGHTDIELSVIGLGCWAMGGDQWGGQDDADSIRTIQRSLELGVSFYDTAEAYGAGRSERVLGQGLVGHRSEVIISTKAAPGHLAPEALRAALTGSLERLRTDYVDLYFIHWPDYDQPIAETMGTLEELRTEGRIRAIGVSNFSRPVLEKAMRHGTIDALQPPYNMLWRFPETDLLPFCAEHGIGVVTYSSLAQGILTDTLTIDSEFPPGDIRPQSVLFQKENYARCLGLVEDLRPVAEQLRVAMPQLCLRWVIEQPSVTSALVGARKPNEIEQNVGALGWAFSPAIMSRVQALSDGVFQGFEHYPDMWFNWRTWHAPKPQE